MKILGNRVLLERVEEEKKEGEFQTVDVQDSFVYKGRVMKSDDDVPTSYSHSISLRPFLSEGDIVLFAKYSPDTQEIEHEGKKLKIVNTADILAIL